MAYDIGQTVRVPVSVKDADGDPIDATMAIEVLRPDGTTFPPPSIVNDGVGEYHSDITTDATNYGTWQWKFSASGTILPAVYTGQFFVRVPGQRIVSLTEAKEHLNKSRLVVTDDEELRNFIDMTTVVLEGIKGPIIPRTITEYHNGGCRGIFLRYRPVISITSVQEVVSQGDVRTLTAEPDLGIGATENQYTIDLPRGRILRRDTGFNSYFASGSRNVKIIYKVGLQPLEANVRMAALELLTHFWRASQLSRGGTRPRDNRDAETDVSLVTSYGVPTRIRQLMGKKKAPRIG